MECRLCVHPSTHKHGKSPSGLIPCITAPSGAVVAEKVAKTIALRNDWREHFSVIEDDKIRMRIIGK